MFTPCVVSSLTHVIRVQAPCKCNLRTQRYARTWFATRSDHYRAMLFELWLVVSAGIIKVCLDGTRDDKIYWSRLVSSLLASRCALLPLELKMAMATNSNQLGRLFITAETLPALRSQLVSLTCYTRSPSLGNILTMTRLTTLQLSTDLGHVAHAAWKLPALRQLELVSCIGSLDALLVNGSLSRLERLSAVSCPFGGEVLATLTRFTTLRELALRNCGLQQLPTLAAASSFGPQRQRRPD